MDELILIIKYLLLGLVQGFTEPIPISSSAHVLLLQRIFNLKIEGLNFELFVNTASLLAVLIIYRKDLQRFITNGIRFMLHRNSKHKDDFLFLVYLVIGTIPVGVAGILLDDYIASVFKDMMKFVGLSLLVTGIGLWLIRNLRGRKNDGDLRLKDAIIVGFAQMIALLPGISRSGATIIAAMGLGMKQETALRFSFLLYIPVSFGGMLLSFSSISQDPQIQTLFIPYLIAFIAAFIASYFSLKWFMGIMARGNLKYFSFYCFILGILVLLFM